MYKIFIVAALAAGCGAGVSGVDADRSELNEGLCPPGQSPVCHQQEDHCLGPGAVAAHLAHGAVDGPCVDIGLPPSQLPPPDGAPQTPKEPAQLAEETVVARSGALVVNATPAWTPQTPDQPQQLASDPPPEWTPQAPPEPASICVADEGHACGGGAGDCCPGLRCAWGACLVDDR
jgi:hypothetical protein